ncbi:hypothetical protein LUZ63_015656 [Rhynchospora breviuscula]|uniref:F-box domain-containing protein n=1 Tax=Rhynchospora breviuscula TaxID=2022672 RepID=A0A9Q0CCR3_9POAL|nr:hypothetical protein LUZ63_015656 [Rhynchospora breviuscula]
MSAPPSDALSPNPNLNEIMSEEGAVNATPPPEPPAEERDWAELQTDALMVIFRKLGMHEVLLRVSKVCSSWRKAAKDDYLLWRRIDMGMSFRTFQYIVKFTGRIDMPIGFDRRCIEEDAMIAIGTEMTKVAVNCGGNYVEQLLIGAAADDANLLNYVADRARNLKSLSLIDNHIFLDVESVANALGRLKQLEELRIVRCTAPSGMMMKVIGTACPQLKRLKLIFPCFDDDFLTLEEGIWTQLGIPKPMLQLEFLQLVFTFITTKELMKILESCPNLERLDLRGSTVEVKDTDIKILCPRLHTLILPDDMLSQARNQYDDRYGDIQKINPVLI